MLKLEDYLEVASDTKSGLRWIKPVSKFSNVKPGSEAGSLSNKGYYDVKFNGRSYRAHRVIYYLLHGTWPEQVDHIDGNRSNNAPENLRAVDNAVNQHNRRSAKGWTWNASKGKFIAQIQAFGKSYHLGNYDTADAAREAYLKAKQHLHKDVPEGVFQQLGLIA